MDSRNLGGGGLAFMPEVYISEGPELWCSEKFNMSKLPPEWELFNEIIALDIDLCFLSKIMKNAIFYKTVGPFRNVDNAHKN